MTNAQLPRASGSDSDGLLARTANFLPRLYLPLLLLLVAAYAWRPLEGGVDFWAHAAVGRWIWAHGRVPRASLFLWTSPHYSWIAHSWLCQLAFYQLLLHGGTLGVTVYNTLLPIAVFFLLWRVWRQHAEVSSWAPLVFALAIWTSAPRYQPRPELVSAFFLTVLLAFLVAWSSGRFDDWLRRRADVNLSFVAAPLVTLFLLWVNLHALVGTGIIVLWLAVGAEGAQALLGRVGFQSENSRREIRARARALLVIAVLCSFATLLNPYGLAYWKAIDLLKPNGQAGVIEEWKPFWQDPKMTMAMLGHDVYVYPLVELALFSIACIAWVANTSRRWAHGAWLFFGLAIFLRSRRMLFISAILFLIVLAANARALESPVLWRAWRRMIKGNILESIPTPMRLLARAGTLAVLVAWVLAAASRHTPADAGTWKTTVRDIPEGAARAILKGHLPRRIFNDYEDSSYLQWRLNGFAPGTHRVLTGGRYPLFIDLLNAYPDRVMHEYLEILDASPDGLKFLAQRKINCVVLGDHRWKFGLAKHLNHSRDWKKVFQDGQSIIWVKKTVKRKP